MKNVLQGLTGKRLILYILGLVLCAVGIVLTKRCMWGISPDSSVPYVLELITGWSLGTWTMLFQFANAFLQMIILKNFRKISIWMQFVYAILFGRLIDLVQIFIPTAPDLIPVKIIYLAAGVICTALGLYILTQTNIVADTLISFVKVISDKRNASLGKVKNIYDIVLAIIAALLSIIFTHQLQAIGIATLVSAICVGRVMHWCKKHLPLKEYSELFTQNIEPKTKNNHYENRIQIQGGD